MKRYLRTRRAGPEAELQRQILHLLDRVGLEAWAPDSGSHRGRSRVAVDMPDILGVAKDGTFFAIEVKRPDGKRDLTPGQAEQLLRIHRRSPGSTIIVARAIEDVRCLYSNVASFTRLAATQRALAEAAVILARPAEKLVAAMGQPH